MSLAQLPACILPPCRVCGAKASGLHYGVNTCEACKAFFRRSSSRGHQFECSNQRSCKIEGRSRSTCAYCRFQKCLRLGMCKDAVLYSCELQIYNVPEIASSEMSNTCEVGTTTDKADNIDSVIIETTSTYVHNIDRIPADNTTICYRYNTISTEDSISYIRPSMENCITDCAILENFLLDELADISIGAKRKVYNPSRIEFYEEIIRNLCDVHKKLQADYISAHIDLREKENDCLEMVKLREQIFGSLKPLPMEEYFQFYEETGIDVDGRRELMESILLPQLEVAVRQHIAFAKAIPGFRELSSTDQIEIIKASRLDFFFLGKHRWFNPRDNLYAFCGGKVVHVSEILKLLDVESTRLAASLLHRLYDLNLRVDEEVLLYALSIMWQDFTDAQYRQVVEESQKILVECLYYIFDKNYQEDNMRFARMINCLTQMKTLRDDDFKCKHQIFGMWFKILKIPPVLLEMCDH